MRLDSLSTVSRIAEARYGLLRQIELVEAVPADDVPVHNHKFSMVIDGNRLGPEFVALVRPIVVRELRAQVKELERDLEALGVKVD